MSVIIPLISSLTDRDLHYSSIMERKSHILDNYNNLFKEVTGALNKKKFPKFVREVYTTGGLDTWTCYNLCNGSIIGFTRDDTFLAIIISKCGDYTTGTILNKYDLECVHTETGFDLLSIM